MSNLIALDELYLDKLECGCHVELDRADAMIVFCPLHENAAFVRGMLEWIVGAQPTQPKRGDKSPYGYLQTYSADLEALLIAAEAR